MMNEKVLGRKGVKEREGKGEKELHCLIMSSGNRNNLEGKLAGDEPYYPSDEATSFETDPDAFSDNEEEGSVASRTRMVGMGVLHTQSGATIINPGMPSERFRNVKSSAVVTGSWI
ncbi:hypothetical protein H5410_036628 [Solanum commersonii]|uniref:Uncharacterized protein n=1 Tax=Solanum commersonii TaxID=4109 RepID=A0A9J5Y7Z8_SOLCO|nr:hypothetical protein H5410_036628 [Solanum commersonii]